MGLNAAEAMDVFYSRCLLCACRPADLTPHLHIFSVSGNQLQLVEKISKYLNIQIDGELPQNVCRSCMEKLEVTHELLTNSQRARVTLLNIRQQSLVQEVKQEILDCSSLELLSHHPATDSIVIKDELDIKIEEIPTDIPNFDQSDAISAENTMETNAIEQTESSAPKVQSANEDAIQPHRRPKKRVNESTSKQARKLIGFELKECGFCKKKLFSQVFEIHLMLRHIRQTYQKSGNTGRTELQCPSCPCIVPSESMQAHIAQQHPPSPNPELKQELVCNYCHQKFSFCDMSRHLQSHGPNAWTECPHCNKLIRNTRVDLEAHLFQDHRGGKLLVCKVCDRKFAVSGKEQPHMQTALNYKYNCPLQTCDELFESFPSFRAHVLGVHAMFEQEMQADIKKEADDILKSLVPIPEIEPKRRKKKNPKTIQEPINTGNCENADPKPQNTDQITSCDPVIPNPQNTDQTTSCDSVICDICNVTVQHKFYLIHHKNERHNLNLKYDCPECGDNYLSFTDLMIHFDAVHSTRHDLNVNCDICDCAVKNRYELIQHKNGKHHTYLLYDCEFCGRDYTNFKKLKRHLRLKHLCNICKENVSNIIEHKNQIHNLNLTFDCERCRKKFITLNELKRHFDLVHTAKKTTYDFGGPVTCEICDCTVKHKYYLVKHKIEEHGMDLEFECDCCEKKYSEVRKLLRHVREKQLKSSNKQTQLSCDVCSEKANNKYELMKHKNMNHNSSSTFECDLCSGKFTTLHELMAHYDVIHFAKNKRYDLGGPVNCDICNYGAKHKYLLMKHQNEMHDMNMTFGCEYCSTNYSTLATLMRHFQMVHSVKQLHESGPRCDICSFKSNHKYDLIQHKNQEHNLGLTFDCENCKDKFSALKELLGHIRLKHGVKQSCAMCESDFKSKFALIDHINSMHLDVVLQPLPFHCEICDREFVSGQNFMRHWCLVHTAKCQHCGQLVNRSHLRKHHNCKDVARPVAECRVLVHKLLQCDSCSFYTNNKSQLESHMQTHLTTNTADPRTWSRGQCGYFTWRPDTS